MAEFLKNILSRRQLVQIPITETQRQLELMHAAGKGFRRGLLSGAALGSLLAAATDKEQDGQALVINKRRVLLGMVGGGFVGSWVGSLVNYVSFLVCERPSTS